MIDIKLTPASVARFNAFLDRVAPQYDRQEAALEMIDVIAERYQSGEDLSWEVRASHSATARPEEFRLDRSDIIVTDAGE